MSASWNCDRSDEALDAFLGEILEQLAVGESRWPGMTYEQGLRDALSWAFDDGDYPFEDPTNVQEIKP